MGQNREDDEKSAPARLPALTGHDPEQQQTPDDRLPICAEADYTAPVFAGEKAEDETTRQNTRPARLPDSPARARKDIRVLQWLAVAQAAGRQPCLARVPVACRKRDLPLRGAQSAFAARCQPAFAC